MLYRFLSGISSFCVEKGCAKDTEGDDGVTVVLRSANDGLGRSRRKQLHGDNEVGGTSFGDFSADSPSSESMSKRPMPSF